MKKYLIVLVFILVSIPSLCQDYTEFMDISMNNNMYRYVCIIWAKMDGKTKNRHSLIAYVLYKCYYAFG